MRFANCFDSQHNQKAPLSTQPKNPTRTVPVRPPHREVMSVTRTPTANNYVLFRTDEHPLLQHVTGFCTRQYRFCLLTDR
jgi:hypothetical protein